MKYFVLFVVSLVEISAAGTFHDAGNTRTQKVVSYFDSSARSFEVSCRKLVGSIRDLDTSNKNSILHVREQFKECRIRYKSISFFLEYFFPTQAMVFNGPARMEIEEPSLEFEQPRGLQVIEGLLFQKNILIKKDLFENAQLIEESAKDLHSLLYQFSSDDQGVLSAVEKEFCRIKTLYLGGYDCQFSKNAIGESASALQSIRNVLSFYLDSGNDSKLLTDNLSKSIAYLNSHDNPYSFDFANFLSKDFRMLAEGMKRFLDKKNIATNSLAFLDTEDFSQKEVQELKGLRKAGEKLFFDKTLSGNGLVSCATCHQPDHGFAEPITAHASFDHKSKLPRNTPTLSYSTLQGSEFWDGRAATLSEQIEDVLTNHSEMNNRIDVVVKRVNENPSYKNALHKKEHEMISIEQIEASLVAYLATLAPANSRYDAFMKGDSTKLSRNEQDGFNLFMGKAQCATCHFIPLMNGLLPPDYRSTEYEILGVPASADLTHPKQDDDAGRYNKFPIAYYKGAFKTPTLRNIAETAPYMHNGMFKTLSSVLEFYNKGGGQGLGLDIPNQTLAAEPLHLTKHEMRQIILFLTALSDSNIRSVYKNR